MGPRLFSRGYMSLGKRDIHFRSSSMGPRLFSRGYLSHPVGIASRAFVSSMGPRLFSRGYRCARDRRIEMTEIFNGATTLQPWIRPPTTRPCSRSRIFNGATTLQPWIHLLQDSAVTWEPIFNGATTLQPWILVLSDIRGWILQRLQWGHDSSAVDTRTQPSYIRDNPALQWGHDSSAVDTPTLQELSLLSIRLQWGHDSSAVDTSMRARCRARRARSSRGPIEDLCAA